MKFKAFIEFLSESLARNPGYAEMTVVSSNGSEVEGMGVGSNNIKVIDDYRPKHSDHSKWETFEAMLRLARIDVLGHWELANGYWPRSYAALCDENPWWLVKTCEGLIEIGWRKRVISIDWSDTPIRRKMTGDDQTTSDEKSCHAWTEEKAIEYLTALGKAIEEHE